MDQNEIPWYLTKQIIYRNMRIRKDVERTYEVVKQLQKMMGNEEDQS